MHGFAESSNDTGIKLITGYFYVFKMEQKKKKQLLQAIKRLDTTNLLKELFAQNCRRRNYQP
jgi:hypothetical protein